MNTHMNSTNKSTAHYRRSGMALLFVVSLILFITLLGASFVVISQQFATTAKNRARIQARGDLGTTLVQRAFYDLLRGPENPNSSSSPLANEGLLPDMYGYGISAEIQDASLTSARIDGALQFELRADPVTPINNTLRNTFDGSVINPVDLPHAAGSLNGQVLTFVDGPLRGTSVRIIGYTPLDTSTTPATLPSVTIYQEWSTGSVNASNIDDLDNNRVIINGRQFHGWGHDVMSGVNESYDAVDSLNNFLGLIDNETGTPSVKASFDRTGTMFRALGTPGDALQVDNDGDGGVDSIWMDLGYPVQTDLSGRRYKTLVSYMIVDMDGRFNVNAHGDFYDLDVLGGGNGFLDRLTTSNGLVLGDVEPLANHLPHGHYLGPPEITMAPLFGLDSTNRGTDSTRETALGFLIANRYGDDGLPGSQNIRDAWSTYVNYGHPWSFGPPEDTYRNAYVGGLFGTAMDFHGRYGSGIPAPPNLTDTPVGLTAMDSATTLTAANEDEIINSAYEFDITKGSRFALLAADVSDDTPYTPKEVERIIRQFDRDAKMLPSRLWENTFFFDHDSNPSTPPIQLLNPEDRHLIGGHSWHVPAIPGLTPNIALGETAGRPVTINERVYNLLVQSGMSAAAANQQLGILLSPEVRSGLPFDLNRLFANGRDDNRNNVYDEHWDPNTMSAQAARRATETIDAEYLTNVQGNDVQVDGRGNGPPIAEDHLARAIFARHLYVLVLLATDDTSMVTGATGIDRRTAVAQWAINVVDFRDSDSINTPFEFDVNPFDGWDVDGLLTNPATDPVVWGLERPELLISETLATHDRRLQDDSTVGGGDIGSGSDSTFDSLLVPRAATHIELHHPWIQTEENQLLPAELADSALSGIDLAAKDATNTDPVWRMVALRGTSMTEHPDAASIADADIARKIYFTTPNLSSTASDSMGTGPAFTGQKVYFPTSTSNSVIDVGGYGVVGSSGVGSMAAAGETFFGRRTGPTWNSELTTTRKIVLDSAGRQVRTYDPVSNTTATRNSVATVIIDQHYDPLTMAAAPRSLGLSDPDAGYINAVRTATAVEDGFLFDSPLDEPIDANPSVQTDPISRQKVLNNGTSTGFRRLHLQRLANPLAPYDPSTNPYLTIDSKFVDLVAFNGVEPDTTDPNVTDGKVLFATNERGRKIPELDPSQPAIRDPLFEVTGLSPAPLLPEHRRLLWPQEGEPFTTFEVNQNAMKPHFMTVVADSHVFSFELHESMGQLNDVHGDEELLNHMLPQTDLTMGPNPPIGFAGLNWQNRPYSSQFDLMDVPFADSYSLLGAYSAAKPVITSPSASSNPYDSSVAPSRGGVFGHLINFYAAQGSLPDFPDAMGRLFDFVTVPSRFAGMNIHFENSAAELLPPFNKISRFREPGRININTMTDTRIWNGWLAEYGTGTTADGFFINGSPNPYILNPISKMQFDNTRRNMATKEATNPIRNFADYDKGPMPKSEPVEVSILRQNEALFGPMLNVNSNLPYADPNRDSTVRHQALRRIGNTVTTRSNVYAIWITVGRFEVDEEGMLLPGTGTKGVELGRETGNIERHRAFYMIDRSIPVAFEPGQNHNIENMILIESMIK